MREAKEKGSIRAMSAIADWCFKHLKTEWRVIRKAPVAVGILHLAGVAAGIGGSYLLLTERLAIMSARVEQYKDKLDGASPEQAAKQIIQLKRANVRIQLQRFHDQLGAYIDQRLPINISTADYKKYADEANDAFTDTHTYITNNLGVSYAAPFTERSAADVKKTWPQGISAEHNELISNLTIYRKNLENLIKSDAWEPRL